MVNLEKNIHNPVILLTGGSGFLGKAIVRELLDPASPISPLEIRIFDQNNYNGIKNDRIKINQGDIRDYSVLLKAMEGVDVVIHNAALIDWGTKPKSEVMSINVGGTVNVINACSENNVRHLVYTSSLDAVYSGRPLIDVDESLEYPEHHKTSYCESKYLAELKILEANGEQLNTCILRPSDIYGEEDPYHIGSLIEMAKTGFYIRLGNGKSKCQHVYVGNMAWAHILAVKALLDGNVNVKGNVYFITDGPGTNFFTFFDQILSGAGYRFFPKNLWLPKWIAYPVATISELVALLVRPIKRYSPKFSRFAVTYTCTDFTFNSDKAKKHFGYTSKYTEQHALERTIKFYKK